MKAHWLRRRLVLFIEHTKPTTEQAIITHADAKAIRRTVLGRLTTFERAFLWRWCISMAVIYAGLFAVLLLVISCPRHSRFAVISLGAMRKR